MSKHQQLDRTLALAGLAQNAELVQSLARTGKIDQSYLDLSVKSLFAFNAQSVEDIYGDITGLKLGLNSLANHFFKPKSPVQAEIMRYAFQLLQLAKKVQQSDTLSQALADQLHAIEFKDHDYSGVDGEKINQIAQVYLQLISPLKPRVIVSGEQGYLAQKETASKVRVCLLCGIRSAFLWLQKGGGKLQLLTARKSYQNHAVQIVSEMI